MKRRLKTTVIILNWNGLTDTIECLDSLSKSQTKQVDLSVLVVDNASSDNSVTVIKKKYPQIELLVNPANLGFAGGNNVGIRHSLKGGADYVVLLNNDTTVSPQTIEALVTESRAHKYALASPKIYFYPGNEFHRESYNHSERGKVFWYAGGHMDWANIIPSHLGVDEVDHGQYDLARETEFATGCCLAISKAVIDRIGVLDESYHMYFEDNDLCQRASRAGFKVGYIPQAHMWHKNAGSTGGSGSIKQAKLVNQSRIKFGLRYGSFRTKFALIRKLWLPEKLGTAIQH